MPDFSFAFLKAFFDKLTKGKTYNNKEKFATKSAA
jgi:hypothetical protein